MATWTKQYEKMMEDESITYAEVAEYVSEFIPQKLYRYRNFDKYWTNNIFEGQVNLNKASRMNDPYDSAIKLDYLKLSEKYLDDEKYQLLLKNESKKKLYLKDVETSSKKMYDQFREEIKISCFSEVKDSLLMWSHYANNHQGYCIEYDTSKEGIFKKLFFPVIYKRERYDATQCQLTTSPNLECNPVLFKASCWKYEKEWRIFGKTDFFCHDLDVIILKNSISGIYLGANSDEKNLKNICEWGAVEGIPIYKMELNHDKYKLVPKKLVTR